MHADKWGPIGSIFTALCCLGAAPVLAALSAIGLGFVISDAILIPLLIFFLGATIFALRSEKNRHHKNGPSALAWAASALAAGGLWLSGIVVGLGLLALVAASLWNWRLVHAHRASPLR
ncbi:MAG: MerC family mercury resistance protein [Gemmatimonadales bacterium]